MTPASLQALHGLRDLTTLKWYVIPLLAIVFYIYAVEINKARNTGNWNAVLAGLLRPLDHARRHGPAHHGGLEH